MGTKNKYVALVLLLSFISCDLLMNDEMKEKSSSLLDKVHSVLDASVESIKDKKFNKKKRRVLKKKRPSTFIEKKFFVNGSLEQNTVSNDVIDVVNKDGLQQSDIVQEEIKGSFVGRNDIVLKEENIPSQQDVGVENLVTENSTGHISSNKYERKSLNGNSNFLNGESGELKETVEGNAIDFTMDSDLRPESISGAVTVSHTDEIEEENYEQYYWDEEESDEEETRLDNRYKSYLEGFKYNIDVAISIVNKIYNNYKLFEEQKTRMYSTYFDQVIKDRAKEEAKKFTKDKLEQDLKILLNHIKVSARTAENFVYQRERYAIKRLDEIGTQVQSLISIVKDQIDSYEAYKAILRNKFLQVKDSLNVMQETFYSQGSWY